VDRSAPRSAHDPEQPLDSGSIRLETRKPPRGRAAVLMIVLSFYLRGDNGTVSRQSAEFFSLATRFGSLSAAVDMIVAKAVII
jgi:hypothetical protein